MRTKEVKSLSEAWHYIAQIRRGTKRFKMTPLKFKLWKHIKKKKTSLKNRNAQMRAA